LCGKADRASARQVFPGAILATSGTVPVKKPENPFNNHLVESTVPGGKAEADVRCIGPMVTSAWGIPVSSNHRKNTVSGKDHHIFF
jgi:hypothetical protein